MPDNPLPVACVALLIAIPPMWEGALRVAAALSEDDELQTALAPALALAGWLLSVHVLGLWARAFLVGLVAGTLLAAALGVVAMRALPPAPPRRRRRLVELVAPLVAGAIIAPMALGWAFHDELVTNGHWALVSEMQNGVYPPRYTTFPDMELRYHYGFNVLVAAVTAVTRLGVGLAIDVVTIACFAYAFRLLMVIGDRVVGRGRGLLTAALTLFGGGIPFFCDRPRPFTVMVAVGQCTVDESFGNPPVSSYFFQHAWTIGLPLAFAAVLLCVDERPLRPAGRRLALGVIMVALAVGQFILFLTLTGALVVHEALAGSTLRLGARSAALSLRVSRRSLLRAALTVGPMLLVAGRMHGFFLPSPNADSGIVGHLGAVDSLPGALRWHAATYGVMLPLGLAGLFWMRRGGALFATLIAGSLLVINVVRYRLSWDIMKFATVASLALAVPASAALSRLLALRPRVVTAPVFAALLAASLFEGLAYPVVFGLDMKGIPLGNFFRLPLEITDADRAAVAWLRRRARRDDSVYRSPPAVWGYATWGGLAHPWPDGTSKVFLDARYFTARERLLKTLPPEIEQYTAHRIRWMVLAPTDKALLAHAERWTAAGQARLVAQFGPLRVYELGSP